MGDGTVIVIAQDHHHAADVGRITAHTENPSKQRIGRAAPTAPERFLIIGWNLEATVLLHDLRLSAPEGSAMTLLIDDGIELPSRIQELVDEIVVRSREIDPLDDEHFLSRF